MRKPIQIIGQGLAGTCLAWCLDARQVPYVVTDTGSGGSSRVAAGLVNPVTGKNFQPSWRIQEFLPEAMAFYESLEHQFGIKLWYSLPVLRLVSDLKVWEKIRRKCELSEVMPWVVGEVLPPDSRWVGAIELRGGGRLDMPKLLDASRRYFIERGTYIQRQVEWGEEPPHECQVWCEGAAGLIQGRPIAHRCAKGEILTVQAEHWDDSSIRIGSRGWVVPIGNGQFRVGATYEWNELNETLTEKGRLDVEQIARELMDEHFSVVDHHAGIRPIVRRSEPLVGRRYGTWFFNGLGSKGALYAPGVAERLTRSMVSGERLEADLDLEAFCRQIS